MSFWHVCVIKDDHQKDLLLVLGESVSLLGINKAESDSSSGGLDTVNISLQIMNSNERISKKSDTKTISPIHGQIFDTVTARAARAGIARTARWSVRVQGSGFSTSLRCCLYF